MRDRGWRRKQDYKHARHKLIGKRINYGEGIEDGVVIGKLIKGKVHCSCPCCTPKKKTNGYKASDRRKLAV